MSEKRNQLDDDLLATLLECDMLCEEEREAFEDMRYRTLPRFKMLTKKQRAWAERVAEQLELAERAYNLWSSGTVPRGREVPTPEVLKNRPLKPPGK